MTRHSATVGVLVLVLVAGVAVSGCGRGAIPPEPSETLVPTVIGFIAADVKEPPVALEDGEAFEPSAGARVERVRNWPADGASEPDSIRTGDLLIGGLRPDESWWYELVRAELPHGECMLIFGGAFDRGDSVQLASGVVLPKAADFQIRDPEPEPSRWFPARRDDAICVGRDGHVRYLEPFHPA